MPSRWTFDTTRTPLSLREASDALEPLLAASGLSERARHAARLVAEELVLNALEHGGARSVMMEWDGSIDPHRLVFEDDGVAFDPSAPGPVLTDDETRGRGLRLVRAYTRSIEHVRDDGRNRVVVLLE